MSNFESIQFSDSSAFYLFWEQPGCGEVKGTFRLRFRDCTCEAFIPNAFTPNGDQLNDSFSFVIPCSYEKYELKIYKRWGQEVYRSNDPAQHWTGRQAQNDMYLYLLSYRAVESGEWYFRKGAVHVLR